MDAPKSETPADELARLRALQEAAERAARPPEPEVRAPLTGRQQEAVAANEANAIGHQKRAAEEASASETRARGLVERFRAETAAAPAEPPAADPPPPLPRPWWARWRR